MPTSYEAGLLARARELADEMRGLGYSVAYLLLGGARSAGLDPHSFAPLTGAALVLGADQITVYTADAGGHAHPGDTTFLAHVSDAEDDARDLLAAVSSLADHVTAALDDALADEPGDPGETNTGDPPGIGDAAERIALCQASLGLLGEMEHRLRHAIVRLAAVAPSLGEVYESVYNLLRRGGRMPHEGRWVTGEDAATIAVLQRRLARRLAASGLAPAVAAASRQGHR